MIVGDAEVCGGNGGRCARRRSSANAGAQPHLPNKAWQPAYPETVCDGLWTTSNIPLSSKPSLDRTSSHPRSVASAASRQRLPRWLGFITFGSTKGSLAPFSSTLPSVTLRSVEEFVNNRHFVRSTAMAAQKGDYQPIRLVGAAFALGFVAFLLYQRISLYVRRRQFKKLHGCQPPQGRYVGKDPIFGLDLIWRNFQNAKKKVFLESAYKRYLDKGFTLSVRVAGTKIITTIEPENVKTILSLKFKDFSLGNRGPMQEFLGFGIFTTDGERWANSRHMIRPNFVKEQVADLEAFERHIQAMLKKIPTDGTTVDLQELFFQLTIDSATEFLFGESVNSLRYGDIGFAGAFNYSLHDVLTNFRMGPYKRFRRADPKAVEANRICHEFVDKFVDDAIVYREKHANAKEGEEKEEKYVFLHELAKAMGDRRRLRDELLNILLAGRDTTASLLSNMFFELAQKPHMYAKLRAEVSQLKGAKPSYETLKNMKYLKYCMNECEAPTIDHDPFFKLTPYSAPYPPSGAWKFSPLYQGLLPAVRWWSRRKITSIR